MDASNEQILEKRNKYLYPTKVPYYKKPIQLIKARGSRVWDAEGREYLDVIGGIVSISVGHNHPRITKRISEMADRDEIQHTTYLYLSLYMAELAEKLAQVAPGDLEKCYFTNSGSEANETAVLTARVATGEEFIVALRHGYHGGTSGTLSLCGQSTWKYRAQPQSHVVHATEPNCYRCPFEATPSNCHLECAEDIKRVVETTTHGKIAGFICEPVLGVGGFMTPPPEYHKRAFEIVKSFGGKYISDEVQTGVGRTGNNFFAIADSDVVPDMITMAKGFGSGAPVGAVVAKDDCAKHMAGKLHFNTFGGDPYQSMQAAEVIDIIREENLIENAKVQGEYLMEGFKELQKDFPLIGDVRGRGLMIGLELVKDPKTKEYAPEDTVRVMESAKDHGVLIGKGGLFGNVIRLAPALSITREECDELLTGMRKSFEDVCP